MPTGKRTTARKRGRPAKPGQQQAFSLRLPVELHQQLRHYAFDQGASLNDVIVRAVQEWWRRVPDRQTYVQLVDRPIREK